MRPAFLQRSARIDVLVLGLLVALATIFYTVYALRVGSFQQDESLYLHEARFVATHFPSALWGTGLFLRGIQRLDPLILAAPFAFMRGPGAFEVDRVVQCLLFSSTAVPVFLLARGAGLGRAAGLLAATLTIVIPWAVVSGSFLSESAAYPAFAWYLYAAWLTIARPSVPHELLALLTLALAILSRTAMLALVPLLPLAAIWQEWRVGPEGAGALRRVRALPARLWTRHRLMSAISLAVVVVYLAERLGVLPNSLQTLTGEYGLPHTGPLHLLLDRYRYYLSRAAAGTGFIALAIGLPWTLLALVRPREPGRHALAVVCALGLLGMLLSLLAAGADERYVMYAAVPIALAFAAGLGERAGVGALLGALAVDLLIESVTWPGLTNLYDFFTYPVAIFYQRVMLGHLNFLSPLLSAERLIQAAVLAVALAWVIVGRRGRLGRPAAVLLGVGVLVFCSVQTVYALRKYVTGPGGGPSAAARSWVDEYAPSGARVGALAISLGESSLYLPIWEATEYWNTSVALDVSFGPAGYLPFPVGSEPVHLTIQPTTGLLSALGGPTTTTPVRAPEYLLLPLQGTNRIALAGKVVAQSTYLPLELMRLSRPARALWSIAGTSVEGFLTSGEDATVNIDEGALAGLSRPCASFSLIAPPNLTGSWPYVARSGGTLRRGRLHPLQTATVSVPLSPERAGGARGATLTVDVHGQASFFGQVASAKLAFFNVAQCATGKG